MRRTAHRTSSHLTTRPIVTVSGNVGTKTDDDDESEEFFRKRRWTGLISNGTRVATIRHTLFSGASATGLTDAIEMFPDLARYYCRRTYASEQVVFPILPREVIAGGVEARSFYLNTGVHHPCKNAMYSARRSGPQRLRRRLYDDERGRATNAWM